MEYYRVTNKATPQCRKCGKAYESDSKTDICTELYGRGKERLPCGGQVLGATYLDWSDNLLKDYSLLEKGDLSMYEEIITPIDSKRTNLKEDKESRVTKINIQSEIEQAMRSRGINILSWNVEKMNSDGVVQSHLITKSFFKLPFGVSKMSLWGHEETVGRFEARSRQDGASAEGFLKYELLKEGEELKPKKASKKEPKVSKLTCKCGLKAKSAFGLQAHIRACKEK